MEVTFKFCNDVLKNYYGKPEDLYPLYIIMCVLNGFLSLTAVLGNVTIISALRKTSSIPRSTRILLQCLALTDLGTGVLGHPLYIAVISGIRKEYSCEKIHDITSMFFLIEVSLIAASFMTLTFIGVDRFLAIYLHLRYKEQVTPKRVVTVIIVSWIFCLASTFLCFFGFFKAGEVIMLVLGYCSTLLLSIIYIKLFSVARQHAASINSQAQVVIHLSSSTNMARNKALAIKTFYVFVVFLFCYCPYLTAFTVLVASSRPSAAKHGAVQLTTVLLMLNSSLNPVVFGWKVKEVRQIVKSDFKKFVRGMLLSFQRKPSTRHARLKFRLSAIAVIK